MATGMLIHIAEVAVLLFVAYGLGWLVGYLARRLTTRRPITVADVTAARSAVRLPGPTPEDAPVKAPVIADVNRPIPSAPAELPAATIAALEGLASEAVAIDRMTASGQEPAADDTGIAASEEPAAIEAADDPEPLADASTPVTEPAVMFADSAAPKVPEPERDPMIQEIWTVGADLSPADSEAARAVESTPRPVVTPPPRAPKADAVEAAPGTALADPEQMALEESAAPAVDAPVISSEGDALATTAPAAMPDDNPTEVAEADADAVPETELEPGTEPETKPEPEPEAEPEPERPSERAPTPESTSAAPITGSAPDPTASTGRESELATAVAAAVSSAMEALASVEGAAAETDPVAPLPESAPDEAADPAHNATVGPPERVPPQPASRPGEAWSGRINGRAPSTFDDMPPPEQDPTSAGPSNDMVASDLDQGIREPQAASQDAPRAAVQPAPEVPSPPPGADEDAAMRAIEGGWSRRAARALPDAPEMPDVGDAVKLAQSAVERALRQIDDDDGPPRKGAKPPSSRP